MPLIAEAGIHVSLHGSVARVDESLNLYLRATPCNPIMPASTMTVNLFCAQDLTICGWNQCFGHRMLHSYLPLLSCPFLIPFFLSLPHLLTASLSSREFMRGSSACLA
eukprot:Rmarinus@m.18755